MKCEYIGLWSHQGCDHDAEPEQRFCRMHSIQGPSNEWTNKAGGCGCLVAIVLVVVLTTCTVLSVD